MNAPFIYLFKTYRGQYIYDVNTNRILSIPRTLWDELNKKEKSPSFEYSEYAKKQILELQQQGYLSSNRWKNIRHPASDIMPFQLDNALCSIVLQVTQICNLNCSYCPFAQGNYYSRKHTGKQMSRETAAYAIDFLVQHATNSNLLAVGFYGGEPLVNFETVKYTVEYISKKYPYKEFSFFMTTNATLLDEEKIAFLNEHKFNLTISLDGPKEVHDKNRQSFSQESSFEKVMGAIDTINEKYPDFRDRVSFNCVIDPAASFDCFHSFFSSYENVKEFYCRFSNITRANAKDFELEVSNDYISKYNFEVFKCILANIGKISKKTVSPIVKEYLDEVLQVMFDKRFVGNLGETGHPSGPCVPGEGKLFINVDGNIYPCEKVNEMSEKMKIGNIFEGFDIKKCSTIINIAHLTEDECKNCWACRLCYLCCLFCEEDAKLLPSVRLKNCKQVRENLNNYFMIYACLIEHNFDRNLDWFDFTERK